MDAAVLRDYLAGRAGSWRLRRELAAFAEALLDAEAELAPEPPGAPAEPFDLYPRHLLALCEAVAARELPPALLSRVSHVLVRSRSFHWSRRDPDGRVVEEVLLAWSSQAPGALDPASMPLFRDWLVTRRRPGRLDPVG